MGERHLSPPRGASPERDRHSAGGVWSRGCSGTKPEPVTGGTGGLGQGRGSTGSSFGGHMGFRVLLLPGGSCHTYALG